MKKENHNNIYWDPFAIKFRYTNGKLEEKTEVVDAIEGKVNKTKDSPPDILQMSVFCSKCGTFMNYVPSDKWMGGNYVCSSCKAMVNEVDPIRQLEDNSRWGPGRWDDDNRWGPGRWDNYDDIYK